MQRKEIKLNIKKIHTDAITPSYAHHGDAGLDLFSVEERLLKAGERGIIRTGLIVELPKGTEGQIRPRSGLALKHGITLLNSPGTIDEGYRGELGIIIINHGKEDFLVTKGMKIAQMVVQSVLSVEVQEVDYLADTKRGTGGFGSTGQ